MNISRAFSQAFSKRMSVADLDRVMDMMIGGGPDTWSGNKVDENSSLANPTVWACVRVISEAYASMPQHVYRRTADGGKEIARNHYLYPVLHDNVNDELTAFSWREMSQAHLLTWGNHYSLIEYDQAQRVKALYPLPPDRMKVTRKTVTSPREYLYRQNDGTWLKVASEFILHVPGLGYDGIVGYSPIGIQRQTIGASNAVAEFGARFFGNGVRSSGFLEHPGTLTKEGGERLKASFTEKYSGLTNAHKVILLEGGLTFKPNSINPDDAQFLETAKHGRATICGMYRVPGWMAGDPDPVSDNNIENTTIGFYSLTMVPWLSRWEAGLDAKLLTTQGRAVYFIESDANGLMRGDSASRATYYRSMVDGGIMKPNEARSKENLNTEPAGDVYFRPMNTSFVSPDGKFTQVAPQPEKPTPAKPEDKAA